MPLCHLFLQAPAKPQPIFRADYKAPSYLVDTVHLTFNLNEDVTHVTSKLAMKPNYTENGATPPLFLHGRDDMKLVGLKVAGALAALHGVSSFLCIARHR
jgi:aminopeptidase N